MGQDPRVLAVEVFCRGVHVDADRDDGCAVLDHCLPPVGFDGRHEVADVAGRLRDRRVMVDMDQGVLVYL